MPALNSCTRCGAELRPQNSEGFCTRCLLESGLEESLAEPKVSAPGQSQPLLTESETQTSNVERGAVRNFGDYELLEEIARGGMGVVYRARQPSLGRIVALKMILAGQFASKQMIQRFRGEVTAAALLQHPNIVAIHDVGIHDDQHYFSMDYVEGQNLSQLVGNRPLLPGKAARYIKLIAEAIHYAHQQGILHRDLKPSNVLVDASDQPRITDFGLAKRFGVPPSGGQESGPAEAGTPYPESFTLTGQMLGSPNFMPPEQASSQRGKVGRHSDVYGLGAILYHLLTARPPFHAESFESVINQVLNAEPVSPRLLNSSVPPDLETICIKCLQKEPSRRYQSAQELADELDRFLHDKPIHARPITSAERAWRWCRRNPVVAGLGLALVLAITVGFAAVLVELRRVKDGESILRRNLYTSNMNLAHLAWEQGNLQRAQKLLLAQVPQAGKEDLRGFEWRYLTNLCHDESRFTFTNVHFAGGGHGLALATDGQTVIAASGDTLKWLDGQNQREVQTMTVGPKAINGLSMAMDQPGLVAYHTDRIKALSPTGETLLGLGLAPELGGGPNPDPTAGTAFALSWDGTLIAASGTNSTVRIFDLKTGRPLGPEFGLGQDEDISSLAFSPDAKHLACGTITKKIYILEAPKLKRVNELKAHTSIVGYLAFDRTGKKLVSCADNHIRVWNFPDCQSAADLPGQQGMLGDLAFSPDGLWLASGGTDHTVRLWNLANPGAPILLRLLHGHRGAVTSVLFSGDGNQLYTGSNDGTVKVWDVSFQESTNILRVSGWSDEAAFSPDGTLVAVADFYARAAVLWDVASQRPIETIGKHSGDCRGAKFSPDGKLLATTGPEMQVWEISTKKMKFKLPWGSFAFHPWKPLLVIVGKDLRFWDLQNGAQMNLLADVPVKGVETVVFSPNGKWIALGTKDGQVSIRDFVTGGLLHSFHQHTNAINALCFSHDGSLLASGGNDNLVVLYDVRQGVAKRLEGHFALVLGLAFAPEDKTLVSTSWDGTIRFWSMANYQVALTLVHDGGPVNSVAFSPDGNLMATSGSDGTARLWPAAKLEDGHPVGHRRSRQRLGVR